MMTDEPRHANGSRTGTGTPVNIALQGGGSHGAFTWGVLDRLLEDGRLDFDAVSGTSAGAMNAVALADGWIAGGRDGAREKLDSFWRAVGAKGRFSPIQRTPWDVWTGNWSIENSPSYQWYDAISRVVSPYLANALDFNPLRDVVEREIDFERIHRNGAIKVFVSATNVHTGKLHVFPTKQITVDAVMASACLPHIFKAVEIDGIPYWDGGYGGNPALDPFFENATAQDVLLVQINPIERAETPMSSREIENRVDEITFNAALLRELKGIAFVNRLIDAGRLDGTKYNTIRMHRIDADEALSDLSASSKINAEPRFLLYLRDLGRACADDWLEENFEHVGHKATLDLTGEIDRQIDIPRKPLGSRVRDYIARNAMPHRRAS